LELSYPDYQLLNIVWWELFGNCLGIVWELFGNFVGSWCAKKKSEPVGTLSTQIKTMFINYPH